MNKEFLTVIVLAIFIISSISASGLDLSKNIENTLLIIQEKQENIFAPGEIIIGYKSSFDVKTKSIEELNNLKTIKNNKILVQNKNDQLNTILAKVDPGQESSIINNLKEDEQVSYATHNYKLTELREPNDPYYVTKQWGPKKIKCPKMWDQCTGSPSVIIAIIDTGIDLNHPDLKNNLVQGHNFVDILKPNKPEDDRGHGTLCAGIAGAVGNNGIGISGVAWNCKIMPVKVLDKKGYGKTNDIADGITWAADNGADVISLSIGIDIDPNDDGIPDIPLEELKAIEDAVNYAWNKEIIIVAAAGNDGEDAGFSYPAAYDNVISVGACCQDTGRPWFSNYGKTSVDFIAPGVNVYSTMPTYEVTLNSEGLTKNYCIFGGTSAACPHVAGVCGLIKSKYPSLNNQEIWNKLIDTSDQWEKESSQDKYTMEDDKIQRVFYYSFFDIYGGQDKKVKHGLVDASLTLPENEDQPIDPTVKVTIHKVVELDPIDIASEPEWYYRLGASGPYDSSEENKKYFFNYNSESASEWTPNKIYEFPIQADWKKHKLILDIKLMDDDNSTLEGYEDDLADVSGNCALGGNYGGENDATNNRSYAIFKTWYYLYDDFYSKVNNNAIQIRDGWHVTSGEIGRDGSTEDENPLDASTWAQNDAEVWFDIECYDKDLHQPKVCLPDNIDLGRHNSPFFEVLEIKNDANIDPYYLTRIPWFRTDINVDWLYFVDRNGEGLTSQLEGCLAPQESWLGALYVDTNKFSNEESKSATITVDFYLKNNWIDGPIDTKTVKFTVTKVKSKQFQNKVFINNIEQFSIFEKLLSIINLKLFNIFENLKNV